MNKIQNKLESVFIDVLTENQYFILISHIYPDGDSLGSVLALYNIIKLLNPENKVSIYNRDKYPTAFEFLPNVKDIINDPLEAIKEGTIVISLDTATAERGLGTSIKVDVNIDHHKDNSKYGDINIVDLTVSSTCELIAKYITKYNLPINKDIATCLYTGMVTDTGGFVYKGVSSETLKLAGFLIEHGAEPNYINDKINRSIPFNLFNLKREIANNVEFFCENKISSCYISKELLSKYNCSGNELQNFVSTLLDIDTVEIAFCMTETDDGIKVSLRSKSININGIAKRYGGGGHILASGIPPIKQSYLEVKEELVEDLTELFENQPDIYKKVEELKSELSMQIKKDMGKCKY